MFISSNSEILNHFFLNTALGDLEHFISDTQFCLQLVSKEEAKKPSQDYKGIEHQLAPLSTVLIYGRFLSSFAADKPLPQ